ncbi:hypothetical protein [Glutamicibacter sp. V16R2B1]|uniref:hypothetical protein n=1 Tax=unclassified Glutamicibacter TaxID=2627139 RepID=UPI0010FED8C3|nr:hypothetical protein [Glutamicibacter sp. V16R2B1]TLK54348.1 hypothetical protein FDN03_05505 [Glutamicibacter sp. V16R2B1]
MSAELLAVNQISDILARCPHLNPVITTNDKTLLTDGYIDLHDDENYKKATFRGRVDVQVKGRRVSTKTKIKRSFSISTEDLRGYIKTSGVLYFVVFLIGDTNQRKPFYIILNPYKIQDLLDKAGSDKKTVSILLKKFPSEANAVERIVNFALQTKKESPELRLDAALLKQPGELTIYTDGALDLSAPVTLKYSEIDYTLEYSSDAIAAAPLKAEFVIVPESYIGERTDLTVSCGPFTFHGPVRRRIDKETVELQLSPGLSIRRTETPDQPVGSITISMQNSLRGRFNDLGFLLACQERGNFRINDAEVGVELHPTGQDQELQEHFAYLQTLHELFGYLGTDPALVDLDSLIDRRGKQLVQLHHALVKKIEVPQDFDRSGRVYQPVGSYGVELIALHGETPGLWSYRDLFAPDLNRQFIMQYDDANTGTEKLCRVTPYEIVEADRLPSVLNLHLDRIVEAYASISEYPETMELANQTVLNLIRAADKDEARKQGFLSASKNLNQWLISSQGELPHHAINRWQIKFRNSVLTPEDLDGIRLLKRRAIRGEFDNAALFEVACAILLADHEEAQHCFNLLSNEDQERIQNWPIWALADTLADLS